MSAMCTLVSRISSSPILKLCSGAIELPDAVLPEAFTDTGRHDTRRWSA